jgi:lysozyme
MTALESAPINIYSNFEVPTSRHLPAKNLNRRILFRAIFIPACLLLALWLIVIAARNIPKLTGKLKHRSEIKAFGITAPGKYLVYGIDVSHHQGDINWKKVKSMVSNNRKVSFAFIKATEGITRQDKHFSKNWKATKKEGIIRGAYHFYYPSRDAVKQADNFIKQVKLEPGDLPPVVDIEHSNGKSKKQITEGLKTFMDIIEKQYGAAPVLYTNISFYYTYLADDFNDYTVWISGYHGEDLFKEKFTEAWHFWQYSENGRIDGISGKVDCNVFKGTEDDLKKLCLRK